MRCDSFEIPEEGEGARYRRSGLVPCGNLCLSAERCRSSPAFAGADSGLCLYAETGLFLKMRLWPGGRWSTHAFRPSRGAMP